MAIEVLFFKFVFNKNMSKSLHYNGKHNTIANIKLFCKKMYLQKEIQHADRVSCRL